MLVFIENEVVATGRQQYS